ncbi:MAG: hypothetical protein QOH21_2782 [Acidobacteriota bacterium]|jgi:uncharacterized protein (DUF58 family)|nr:hypothetical protein [Acidobacteriota bacterium]
MQSTVPFAFNGVVRLTKVGTTYILATIVIAIAALNTGNNALYIGVALMLGSLLLSGMASKSGLKHLDVEVYGIEEAWAGRPADGMLRVRNRSRIWSVRDVVLTSESLAQPMLLPSLPRRSTRELPAAFLFQHRGLVQVRTIDSYTRYPFGFFLKKRRLRVQSDVVVYPRILPEEIARERFRPATGEQSTANRPGHGTELHSFREYVRGDSLRHVYWKKSASLGRWIIKQTDVEAARSVHVVVDPYKPYHVTDDAFEAMVSEAATFIHHAVSRELDVLLSLPRMNLRATPSQSAAPLFRALALLEPVYEPVHQTLERNSVYFSAGRRDEPKSA